jgi:hypothetical protein
MSATGFTPISLYYSTTASAVPLAANLVAGELAINTLDGKLYYKNNSNVVTLLAAASGASGDVVGPASATDTAVALFDGATGKLIKNSPVTIGTTGNTVISGTDNSNAMLRITQLGTGNALLVEDSSNPDASPFVVDASGNTVIGNTSVATNLAVAGTSKLQIYGSGATTSLGLLRTDASSPVVSFNSGSTGNLPVSSSSVGLLSFGAFDGTSYIETARITAAVDGTPGTSDMPGRLVFSTTADGASTVTERMRIDSSGDVGIGTTNPTSLLQTAGTSSKSAFKTPNIAEVDTISATAATGTINYDVTTQSVLFYTSNASANWTVNFRGSSGTSLNTLMQTGECISATFLVTNGSTAYYNSAVTIDGSSVTPKWQGGTAPTSGNANSVDSYTYVLQKTGSATYVVLAAQTKFA